MIFWALGTTCIFLLAILIIPLGFTFKGKLMIVLTSLVLSLGGVAAAANFPLWLTVLMLLALVFFASYFMHQRFESLLFPDTSFAADLYEGSESDEHNHQNGNVKEDNLELQESFPSNTITPISASLQMAVDDQNNESEIIMEEDISFLQERDLLIEIQPETSEVDESYLSDIESLLEKDRNETRNLTEEELIEEISKSSSTIDEDKEVTLEPLDGDSLFDFLRSHEEAEEEIKEKVM